MPALLYGFGLAFIAAGGYWLYATFFGGAPVGAPEVYYAAALLAALPGFSNIAVGVGFIAAGSALSTLRGIHEEAQRMAHHIEAIRLSKDV